MIFYVLGINFGRRRWRGDVDGGEFASAFHFIQLDHDRTRHRRSVHAHLLRPIINAQRHYAPVGADAHGAQRLYGLRDGQKVQFEVTQGEKGLRRAQGGSGYQLPHAPSPVGL